LIVKMEEAGHTPNHVTWTTVVNGLLKANDMDSLHQVAQIIKARDVKLYPALHHQVKRALARTGYAMDDWHVPEYVTHGQRIQPSQDSARRDVDE